MNTAQKRYIIAGAIIVAIIVACIIKADWVVKNMGIVSPLAILLFFFIALLSGERIPSFSEGSAKNKELFATYPILKIWVAICALASFSGMLFVIINNIRLYAVYGPGKLILIFVVFLFPLWVAAVINKYKELGD